TVEEGTQPAKRRVPQEELDGGDPDAAAVLDTLVAGRLLTLDRDSVQIAHEALIRHWLRLAGWIDDDRGGLRPGHQLAQAPAAPRAGPTAAGVPRPGPPRACPGRPRRPPPRRGPPGRAPPPPRRKRGSRAAALAPDGAGHLAARRRTRRSRQLVALLATLLV